MTKRFVYYRLKSSRVWHFMKACRFWPPKLDPEQDYIVARFSTPTSGVLCDYCQRIELRKRKHRA